MREFPTGRNLSTTPVKRSIAAIFAALLAFVAFPNAWGQSAGTGRTEIAKIRTLQIDAWARPGVGQFVPADDLAQYLIYELYVTSWNYTKELRFATVDVEDAATGKRLARFDSQALEDPLTLRITQFPGTAGPANRLLPPGRTAILLLNVKLPLGASVPGAVRHRLQFEPNPTLQLIQDDGSLSSELVSVTEPMSIDRRPPLVIDPPLRGGPWYCSNGIGAFTNHDWSGASENIARMYVSQRFGCDFGKAGAESDINTYGAEVVAVADGRVVKAQDEIPENVRQGDGGYTLPVPMTNRTLTGNMIVLEIGERQYAYYAHLQFGSLRVKVGDQVRKGQLLAKVGNSGNASGPHLHFHVCNAPGPNGCDPVPHVYRSYLLSGHLKWNPKRSRKVEFQAPTNGSIMTFSGPGDYGPLEASSREPNWTFHDTFTRQYSLARSPRVEIKGVTGPIVISSGQTRTADIKVQRSAITQQELDCFQTSIAYRPDLITISHVQFTNRPGCGSIRYRQMLTLQVPSDTFLHLSNIYYAEVKVTGPVGGIIAENIGGHVSIEAAGTVNLRKLGNGVSLGLGAASAGSVTIESVFGNVELDVAERRDVAIRVSSHVGEITSVPSGFVRLKTDDGYLLKSGEGGASLSLKRIDGDVVVKRR